MFLIYTINNEILIKNLYIIYKKYLMIKHIYILALLVITSYAYMESPD